MNCPYSKFRRQIILQISNALILSMVCLLELSHNYCGTGILPVQDRLFGRCLFTWRAGEAKIQGTEDLIQGAQLFSGAQTN